MPKEIHLLLGDGDFYGQARKPWVSMDTSLLVKCLGDLGYSVFKHAYHEVLNSPSQLSNSIVLYSFSQIVNMRSYLRDLIWQLHRRGNLVIPSWEFLCCHENKGYQEQIKRELGIDQPRGWYLSNLDALGSYKLSYPVVLKGLEGSNSTAVSLVHNESELRKGVRALSPKQSLHIKLDLLRRKYLRGKKHFEGWQSFSAARDAAEYSAYLKPQMRFVLQEFIAGLDSDYRVLIFWDKYYVSRRMTREGDWRASGAKRFRFDKDIPRELLDRAAEIHRIMPSPMLAVDMGWKDGKVYLFEFQASHCGMNTAVRNPGYFMQSGSEWQYMERDQGIEFNLARAVDLYLQHSHPELLN